MYNAFFGFKERPFQLVPNPAYLFLSKCHEEALAHLVYAISHGDGFVEIIGEVGTGKTTLCRVFLENLDGDTEAAYIFNPKLDAVQLLKTINNEFGVDSASENIKVLIDTLNDFLMAEKAAGKTVILLIDEAQNLSKEVLEQLRLLSNLETTTEKLLQIILVGQPELEEMLHSYQLRQLGQRITLRCHLTPLTYKETKEYIEHRIHIASTRPKVKFSTAAFREIYAYAKGVPRLINIVCDRSLLTAFGYNQLKIDRAIVKGAIRELQPVGKNDFFPLRFIGRWLVVLSCMVLVITLALFFYPEKLNRYFNQEVPQTLPVTQTQLNDSVVEDDTPQEIIEQEIPEVQDVDAGNMEMPSISQTQEGDTDVHDPESVIRMGIDNLEEWLPRLSFRSSRINAVQAAMALWGERADINFFEDVADEQIFFQLVAKKNSLSIRRFEGTFSLLQNINLPAVLRFEIKGDTEPRYLTLCKIQDTTVILCGLDSNLHLEVSAVELEDNWPGVAFVPWKNFMGIEGTIPDDTSEVSIRALKALLLDLGYTGIDETPYYDERTREIIMETQKKHGINIDGVVGSSTKIVLYNENEMLTIPHINQE